ncbi:hypothetical protein CDCA_CDCA08G2472 [Cyanidium caldarium]|uniref:Uncharacterized protein n=1 Tax=Cyanidium caldarium TaxID=2771 RepID=A0AAV9IVT4_CYACA|nr:hypothetical protein CDCA_CDCA08G2472 [Cyanidium caldarium]
MTTSEEVVYHEVPFPVLALCASPHRTTPSVSTAHEPLLLVAGGGGTLRSGVPNQLIAYRLRADATLEQVQEPLTFPQAPQALCAVHTASNSPTVSPGYGVGVGSEFILYSSSSAADTFTESRRLDLTVEAGREALDATPERYHITHATAGSRLLLLGCEEAQAVCFALTATGTLLPVTDQRYRREGVVGSDAPSPASRSEPTHWWRLPPGARLTAMDVSADDTAAMLVYALADRTSGSCGQVQFFQWCASGDSAHPMAQCVQSECITDRWWWWCSSPNPPAGSRNLVTQPGPCLFLSATACLTTTVRAGRRARHPGTSLTLWHRRCPGASPWIVYRTWHRWCGELVTRLAHFGFSHTATTRHALGYVVAGTASGEVLVYALHTGSGLLSTRPLLSSVAEDRVWWWATGKHRSATSRGRSARRRHDLPVTALAYLHSCTGVDAADGGVDGWVCSGSADGSLCGQRCGQRMSVQVQRAGGWRVLATIFVAVVLAWLQVHRATASHT